MGMDDRSLIRLRAVDTDEPVVYKNQLAYLLSHFESWQLLEVKTERTKGMTNLLLAEKNWTYFSKHFLEVRHM